MLEIDTKTGARSEAVPARADHAAIGLKYDKHADRLFVSGGPTGKAFVYDASSGVELASFQLTAAGEPTFINDVVLTRDTAYFTDSLQPVIYAVKRDLSGVTPIPLSGFPMTAGAEQPQRHRGGARTAASCSRSRARRASCGESTPQPGHTSRSTSTGSSSRTATGCC